MEPDDDKTQTPIVLTKGTVVSHYRIVEKIGADGMVRCIRQRIPNSTG